VLVPRYKLSLCHTPIKPDLLGFPGIGVFVCGLRDHVITRFALNWLRGVILILLVHKSIFVGWGFLFPIVLAQVQVIFVLVTQNVDVAFQLRAIGQQLELLSRMFKDLKDEVNSIKQQNSGAHR